MARSEDDIIDVEFTLRGRISIDLERAQEDPIWKMASMTTEDPNNLQQLLYQYLSHYILREKLLSDCPATNGPGNLQIIKDTDNG